MALVLALELLGGALSVVVVVVLEGGGGVVVEVVVVVVVEVVISLEDVGWISGGEEDVVDILVSDVALVSSPGVRFAVMKITSSVEGSRPMPSELSMDMGTYVEDIPITVCTTELVSMMVV